MTRTLLCFALLLSFCARAVEPLRIFIRAGEKTHGPNQHDHPRFLADWKRLLNERGALADGAMNFPTESQLEKTDVLVMYAAEAGTILPEQRVALEKFLTRGGGLVMIHDAVCGTDSQWFKTIIGGAWEHGHSKWFEGNVALYFQDHSHPITKGVSNFDLDDEMYYDLHIMPDAHILAATYAPDKRNLRDGKMFPSVYDIVPQMWTYEKTLNGGKPYRAFVSIPGHNYKTFSLPQYRALLLRGIAWAGKRDINSLASKEELASLRYPEGGPTAPEKAASKIVVHPDFNINLVAAEPLIEKPISLDWDARGRMWIAETPEYPNGRKNPASNEEIENRPAHDRISILEDSNGDGVLDKKKIFYEGLELVTSLVFYKDGVIVSRAPEIYWLRDTNHDDVADEKITLFTGFGTRDAHAVVSNLRWGLDSWIYATVGYSRGDIFSGDGKTHFGKVGDGVIRFKPDGSAMEQFCSKNSNTWGVDIAPDGEIFFSQANGNHINHVVVLENALARGRIEGTTSYKTIEDHKKSLPIGDYSKQAYVQIDVVGGFTAASGACIYNGGAWPKKYDGTFFVTEPTVNIVHEDFLKADGVTYIASREAERADKEFIASTDLWFRPIHTRVGPDGALYILDFYNQAVVHNDTRGPKHGANNAAIRPDRDHYFGRIWRVQHKDAKRFEVPDFAKASPKELVKALEHPNGWVRQTAQRLLLENSDIQTRNVTPVLLENLAINPDAPESARILAYWTLAQTDGGLFDRIMKLCAKGLAEEKSAVVRKNIAKICSSFRPMWSEGGIRAGINFPVRKSLNDPNPRAQLEFLLALANMSWTQIQDVDVAALYHSFDDPWRKSALIGIASQNSELFLREVLRRNVYPESKELVQALAEKIAARSVERITAAILTIADAPTAADSLKQTALETFASEIPAEKTPVWFPELQKAFQHLLASRNEGVRAAALPLIARWDKSGAMKSDVGSLMQKLIASLNDSKAGDAERFQSAKNLAGLRQLNSEIVPSIGKLLAAQTSVALKTQIVELLGTVPEAGGELVNAYPKLSPDLQSVALNQILKRTDWSLAFLDAISENKIDFSTLNPLAVNRLQTHGDAAVAKRAAELIEKIRGPQIKAKDELIAKFTPAATQVGNAENGHRIFTQNCAVCHRFNGEGKDLAPDLSGMGVHGAAELLVHILDPNRVVEPNFMTVSVETAGGETVDGIVGRETKSQLVLRNAAGDVEIKKQNVKAQKQTGRSLMPEGFEALGGESLRDLLTFICAGEKRFRVIDLTSAFTANSTRGIYSSAESLEETLSFKKFGMIHAGEVPFEIANPFSAANGKNVILLKGGSGAANTMPQKVEVANLNLKANRLHFLGGVAGWGWPWGDVGKIPVAKISVQFADGKSEEFVLKNGEEIADYIGHQSVPGSEEIPGVLEHGQVRWFSRELKNKTPIQKITLESFANAVAPTFVAITAEVGEKKIAPETIAKNFQWTKHPRVLIVGGNASHDFERWFHQADVATLSENASVNYTEDISRVSTALKEIDVLFLSNNQPMSGDDLRREIFDFANSGKGLLLVHPALWYNWSDWPEYNRVLVGGGARGHEKYGEFEVTVNDTAHPIMAGVPKIFRLSDELYRHVQDTNGTPIEVLATGKSLVTGKTYPVVWITKLPKAKIVCVTLGHDGAAHDLPAYKMILQNSVEWLAKHD